MRFFDEDDQTRLEGPIDSLNRIRLGVVRGCRQVEYPEAYQILVDQPIFEFRAVVGQEYLGRA